MIEYGYSLRGHSCTATRKRLGAAARGRQGLGHVGYTLGDAAETWDIKTSLATVTCVDGSSAFSARK